MDENATNAVNAAENTQAETAAPEKTFTQAEMNAIAKKEKEEGKRALLKELGVSDFKTAKEGLEAYRKSVEANKTDIEKEREARAAAEKSAAESLKRAEHSEACLLAVKAGVAAENADDLVTIAAAKAAANGETLECAIESLKSNPAYSGFFSANPAMQGTGNPIGVKRPQGGTPRENIGERLAKAQLATLNADNPYFK